MLVPINLVDVVRVFSVILDQLANQESSHGRGDPFTSMDSGLKGKDVFFSMAAFLAYFLFSFDSDLKPNVGRPRSSLCNSKDVHVPSLIGLTLVIEHC